MRKKSILKKLFLLNVLSCCVICVMFLFPFWAASAPASVQKGKTAERVPPKPTPQYGGILKILLVMEPASLGDPVARPFDNMGVIIANGAVETLARYDQKGMPVPWLATGWKVSKDLRSIIFTLRKGVKFHDGTDFDAAAAKWNLDRYRTSDNPELKSVESIDVVDDSTIRLNLSTWSSTLIDNFTMHAGMMISPASFQKNGTDWAKVHPTGTGPFKFVSWQRDTGIKFEKFPGYWQKGKPYLDGVEWTIIADEVSRKMAFIKGDGNVLYIIEPKDVKDLEKDGKYYFSAGTLSG
jgi:ABC-type transport system substrate-binding protein